MFASGSAPITLPSDSTTVLAPYAWAYAWSVDAAFWWTVLASAGVATKAAAPTAIERSFILRDIICYLVYVAHASDIGALLRCTIQCVITYICCVITIS